MTGSKLGVLVAIALVCSLGACRNQTADQMVATGHPVVHGRRPSVEKIVSDFLQCRPQDLTLVPDKRSAPYARSAFRRGAERTYRFVLRDGTERGRAGHLTVDHKRCYVRAFCVENRLPSKPGAPDTGRTAELEARFRALSEAWLHRVCPLRIDRLVSRGAAISERSLGCLWRESAGTPKVWTGGEVSMSFETATGQLVTYEVSVPPPVVPKPRVGEAEARRTAQAFIDGQAGRFSIVSEGRLTLSCNWDPEEGPVWDFEVQQAPGPGMFGGMPRVYVDAVTNTGRWW